MAVGEGDPLTGWATVALAAVAVATLIYNARTARRDRRAADRRLMEQRAYDDQRATRERADAEARLAAERRAADQRLDDERAHIEKLRQRERQQDSATRLLVRIADLLPLMKLVPNVVRTNRVPGAVRTPRFPHYSGPLLDEPTVVCERAVDGLRFGGFADLPGLHDTRATEQYRTLAHLVLTAARNEYRHKNEADQQAQQEHSELVALDLWRYATFVRLSLEHLIEQGESLDPGEGGEGVSFPVLNRRPGDKSLWFPPSVPQGWDEAVTRDPNDPQYRAAK
ncbi:hypothetical protein [Amycolatopsis aidingensis]|uniref:hypothetical protein n=1 Tax=Amycolatopsis aidingensis TaxID=2842453 RepID=UPI001C0AB113|nr:hypothetical protein [Amycolatopsis aidingensis]